MHHSHTLPDISYKPNSLACFCATGCVSPLLLSLYHAMVSGILPPLYLYPLLLFPPLAANSHSASVGRRNCFPVSSFNFWINSWQSFQLTVSTGTVYTYRKKSHSFLPQARLRCNTFVCYWQMMDFYPLQHSITLELLRFVRCSNRIELHYEQASHRYLHRPLFRGGSHLERSTGNLHHLELNAIDIVDLYNFVCVVLLW